MIKLVYKNMIKFYNAFNLYIHWYSLDTILNLNGTVVKYIQRLFEILVKQL